MFTGLIEEIGTIRSVSSISGGKRFSIHAKTILDDVKIDDSVSVNGVCLTVTGLGLDFFDATAVTETLGRSTLDSFYAGNPVNLERALCLKDRLGGHLVQGHVDGLGVVRQIHQDGTGTVVDIEIPSSICRYVIEKGSIALNGVSLTVATLNANKIQVAVIPHTWKKTTFNTLNTGDRLNIEVDLIGKYVEKLFPGKNTSESGGLTESRLRSLGF